MMDLPLLFIIIFLLLCSCRVRCSAHAGRKHFTSPQLDFIVLVVSFFYKRELLMFNHSPYLLHPAFWCLHCYKCLEMTLVWKNYWISVRFMLVEVFFQCCLAENNILNMALETGMMENNLLTSHCVIDTGSQIKYFNLSFVSLSWI